MIIRNAFCILGYIIATTFGIKAQAITYFLLNKFPEMGVGFVMALVTYISIGLFILIPIVSFISKKVHKNMFAIYFVFSLAIGIPVSIWSFFVLAMWMG